MRTAILISGALIAGSIDHTKAPHEVVVFFSVVLLFSMLFDIIDVFK